MTPQATIRWQAECGHVDVFVLQPGEEMTIAADERHVHCHDCTRRLVTAGSALQDRDERLRAVADGLVQT